MKIQELQKTFPCGIIIPEPLVQLCTWHETHGYPISGRFELYADIHDSIRWFGTPTLVDRFGVFGSGPDGSLFTFGAR